MKKRKRQIDRQTDIQREREREKERDRQTDRQTDRESERERERQIDRQTDRQKVIDTKIERGRRERQTEIQLHNSYIAIAIEQGTEKERFFLS